MSYKKIKPQQHIEGDLNNPHSISSFVRKWFEALAILNYSPLTINTRRRHMNRFIRWTLERNLDRPGQITKPMLKRYARYLYYLVDDKGKRQSFRSQHASLGTIRAWFKWLCQEDHLPANPASELPLPRIGHHLPRQILTHKQVEQLLSMPDINTRLGFRDRTIMEFFYATGIRRAELAGLDIFDVHLERRVITIRQGKGNKDRVVPLSKRAVQWVEKYLYTIRDQFLFRPQETALFLTQAGERFSPHRLSDLVRLYVKKSGVADKGGAHLLRHAMATGMLENGADIRFIQAMLGHAKLATTQVYTQVSVKKLQQILDATHPAGANKRSSDDRPADDKSKDDTAPSS